MGRKDAIIFGALGGMCPTIAKLAAFYSVQTGADLPELGVWIGLTLFAFLGGIIALGFGATEVRAAIVAGIAAPAIVTNVISGANGAGKEDLSAMLQIPVISVAHAQDRTPDVTGVVVGAMLATGAVTNQSRVIQVNPRIIGGVPNRVSVPLAFVVERDGVQTDVPVSTITKSTKTRNYVVPEGAVSLRVNGETIGLDEFDEQIDIEINTAPTFGGDLLWALGGKRSYRVIDLKVNQEAIPYGR